MSFFAPELTQQSAHTEVSGKDVGDEADEDHAQDERDHDADDETFYFAGYIVEKSLLVDNLTKTSTPLYKSYTVQR